MQPTPAPPSPVQLTTSTPPAPRGITTQAQTPLHVKPCEVFADAPDAFVGGLSAGAQAYVAGLVAPTATRGTQALPAVPPHMAEELFAFADYTLLPALQTAATQAMMQTMTVPRALRLALICNDARGVHDRGYTNLARRCEVYLAHNFCDMRDSAAYRNLSPLKRDKIDRALVRQLGHQLRCGPRSALLPLGDALLAYVRHGHLTPDDVALPHVLAWLSTDASMAVWQALQDCGHNLQRLILQQSAAAFRFAARAGRIDLVTAMWDMVPPRQRDMLWSCCNYGALRFALSAGRAEVVTCLLDNLTRRERIELATSAAVWSAAARSEQGVMLELLRQRLPDDAKAQRDALQILVNRGHAPALARIVFCRSASDAVRWHTLPAFTEACRQGDLEIMDIFLDALDGPEASYINRLHMLQAGLHGAASSSLESETLAKVIARIEAKATSPGDSIFFGFQYRSLREACERGHSEIVRRVFRLQLVDGRAELMGRGNPWDLERSLLAAACENGQRSVVDTILSFADGRAGPPASAWVLQHHGCALEAATRSGDAALIAHLVKVAAQDTTGWQAWLAGPQARKTLRCAAASNRVAVLQAWLDVMPAVETPRLGKLIAEAVAHGASATLDVLIARAEAEPNGDDICTRAMISSGEAGLAPLAEALRGNHTATVDKVLARLDPAARTRLLTAHFEELCKCDLPYFLRHWQQLSPAERARALTPARLQALPLFAHAGVAVHLMRTYAADFGHALAALPDEALTTPQYDAAKSIINAASPLLRENIVALWGRVLLQTTITHDDPDKWFYVRKALPSQAIMRLLAEDNNARFDQACAEGWGFLRESIENFVALSGWYHASDDMQGLLVAALRSIVHEDRVEVLREIFARRPEVRHDRMLRPFFNANDPAWIARRPRIAALLRQG